jgi:DNA invertase Pin-like site-specific DNA recombinase
MKSHVRSSARSPVLAGYARVSRTGQTLAMQRDALKAAGCHRIFCDHGVSGSATRRRGLDAALTYLRSGDTLVVWKVDRLGRSLAHLVQVIMQLDERGVIFRSLSDPIDTASPGARLVLHIMAALAEFERSLIRERTLAGLAAAKRRGRILGRKRSLTVRQIARAGRLLQSGNSHADEKSQFQPVYSFKERSTTYANRPTSLERPTESNVLIKTWRINK